LWLETLSKIRITELIGFETFRDGGQQAPRSVPRQRGAFSGEAVRCYQRAITGFRRTGHRAAAGLSLESLGEAQQAAGDLTAAATSWHQAAEILTDLRHPAADRLKAKLGPAG
jgi:hypothetical protein